MRYRFDYIALEGRDWSALIYDAASQPRRPSASSSGHTQWRPEKGWPPIFTYIAFMVRTAIG